MNGGSTRPGVEARPSPIEGLGVFARRAYAPGDVVLLLDTGRVVDETRPLRADAGESAEHLAYLGPERTVLLPPPERHLNHSCDPNAYLSTAAARVRVVARREIAGGEEVTLDYLVNTHGGSSWRCACGSSRCRGELETSFFELPEALQVEYLPLLEDWFVEAHTEAVGRVRGRACDADPQLVPPTPIRRSGFTLRCWEPADAPLAKAALDSSLEELRVWIPWALDEPSELQEVEERLQKFQDQFFGLEDAVYAIFDPQEGEVLGGVGLHRRVGPGAVEIGYWTRSDMTGRGVATAAAATLTEAAFAMPGVHRIEIHCEPANLASRAIPRKLGYRVREVLVGDFEWPGGPPRDTEVWEMTLGEYREGWRGGGAAIR